MSTKLYAVVIQNDETGELEVVAEYPTQAEALAHAKALCDVPATSTETLQ